MRGKEEGKANRLIQRERRDDGRRRVALAVAGHGCRRGDCGMKLMLAWTLSLTLRPRHGALGGRNTHTHAHADVRAQADQTQGHLLFL